MYIPPAHFIEVPFSGKRVNNCGRLIINLQKISNRFFFPPLRERT